MTLRAALPALVLLLMPAQILAQSWDFSDAPDSYGTLRASNAVRHVAIGPMLGTARDVDADGQPGPLANGDDEDGITFLGPVVRGGTVDVRTAIAGGNARLSAYFDYRPRARAMTARWRTTRSTS